VGLDVGDFGVEDVGHGALAQEDLADHAHALRVLVAGPDLPEAHHRGQGCLQLGQFFGDALVGRGGAAADLAEEALVALEEGDDGLPVVLGDVLGLVAGAGGSLPLPVAALLNLLLFTLA
jgi:hypothetical protein